LVKRYVLHFGEKSYVARNVHLLLFRTRFFVLTKFNVLNGSHVGVHRTYDLTAVHFSSNFNALLPYYRSRATLIRHYICHTPGYVSAQRSCHLNYNQSLVKSFS